MLAALAVLLGDKRPSRVSHQHLLVCTAATLCLSTLDKLQGCLDFHDLSDLTSTSSMSVGAVSGQGP